MRIQKNYFITIAYVSILLLCHVNATAQVNTIDYGKNRIQHTKFKWNFFQSSHFNVHFTQNGTELARFTLQTAEEELPGLEQFVEFGIQRRINIVLYNNYNDYKQSNIGIGLDWPNTGGVTKLVNNKLVVYFSGNHNDLRRQIREGIAKVLVELLLFGDDLGEFAQNQALLDLPKWMTDGYISYVALNWSTELDNDLKNALLGEEYKNFYQFAFEQPKLAGHAFWYYIEEKYKQENVTYLLYLSRIYKNVNRATAAICKKKLKDVLKEFMSYNRDKYMKDIRSRKNLPSGKLVVSKEIGKKDYFRFQANPNPKSYNYVSVEYKKGITRVVLNENFYSKKVLWKSGIKNLEEKPNPNYPLMAWDPKGTRVAIIVPDEGKLILDVYDAFRRIKTVKKQKLPFDLITSMQYMLDPNTLLLSGVRNGQSDIYIYKINEQKLEQITNDIFDDLDASFAAFPNKSGILFSSNRPSPSAATDTALPRNRLNVFLIDNWNKSEFKQISQLSNLKYGNARFPTQYNANHFTYISDETGIGNRWAGFFSTNAAGIDTVYKVGDELLRNPETKELDSTLAVWKKSEPDSVFTFRITEDSSYTFPISNYQSSVLETSFAGDNGQVTELTRQGHYKFLYKLKVDEAVLRKRNVNAKPTEYIKRTTRLDKTKNTNTQQRTDLETNDAQPEDFFESEFADDSLNVTHSGPVSLVNGNRDSKLNIKQFPYGKKFFVDNVTTNFLSNNLLLINRFQPYNNASGPVNLGNANPLNALTRVGALEFMEDYKFTGAYRINYGFQDNEVYMRFDNFRNRIDWGLSYYRSASTVGLETGGSVLETRLISNIYQGNLLYPFNEVQSIRLIAGLRKDQYVVKSTAFNPESLLIPNLNEDFLTARFEYVHDNTINPASNIWHGLRFKSWVELYNRLGGNFKGSGRSAAGELTFNWGFDGRHYLKLHRNFIWAVRVAADVSWGDNKLVYYLGGTDGWLMLGANDVIRNGVVKQRYFNTANRPADDQNYVYQSLAVNMRGFVQNTANGNNAIVINSEFRLPVFSTLFNKPINNAFLRNFQLVQFFDLGNAWNGQYNKLKRPEIIYSDAENSNPVSVAIKAPGIGPFLGSYGFGARSTLLGYFIRFDAGWPMNGFFRSNGVMHVSLGFDF